MRGEIAHLGGSFCEVTLPPSQTSFLGRAHSVPGLQPAADSEQLGRTTRPASDYLGLRQDEGASRLGVDPGTLAKWERDERVLVDALLEKAEQFLRKPPVRLTKQTTFTDMWTILQRCGALSGWRTA